MYKRAGLLLFLVVYDRITGIWTSLSCYSNCTDQSIDCSLSSVNILKIEDEMWFTKCGPSKPSKKKCYKNNEGFTAVSMVTEWSAMDDSSIDDLLGFDIGVDIPPRTQERYLIVFNRSQDVTSKYTITCLYNDIAYRRQVFVSVSTLPSSVKEGCSDQTVICDFTVSLPLRTALIESPKRATTLDSSTESPNCSTAESLNDSDAESVREETNVSSNVPLYLIAIIPSAIVIAVVIVFMYKHGLLCRRQTGKCVIEQNANKADEEPGTSNTQDSHMNNEMETYNARDTEQVTIIYRRCASVSNDRAHDARESENIAHCWNIPTNQNPLSTCSAEPRSQGHRYRAPLLSKPSRAFARITYPSRSSFMTSTRDPLCPVHGYSYNSSLSTANSLANDCSNISMQNDSTDQNTTDSEYEMKVKMMEMVNFQSD